MLFEINVTKAARTVNFECATLPTVTMDGQVIPAESVAYILDYGMRQCLIDPTAGVKRENFDSDAKAQEAAWDKAKKRYDQLVSGKVPTARTPADPKVTEARKNAATLMAAGVTAEEIAAFIAARQASTVAADSTLIPASPKADVAAFVAEAKKSRKAHA